MTRESEPPRPEELNAYLDGELSGRRRRAVERALARDPSTAAWLAAYRAQDDALRRGWADLAQEDGAALEDFVAVPARRRPAVTRWTVAAAAAALVVALALGGWLWTRDQARQAQLMATLTHEATTAHMVYSQKASPPVDRQAVAQRFAAAFGPEYTLPELSRFGLRLIEARELRNDMGAAMLLIYADKAGQRVSCYFAEMAGGETGFELRRAAGIQTVSRLDEGVGYAVVGALSAAELRAIAAAGYSDAGS